MSWAFWLNRIGRGGLAVVVLSCGGGQRIEQAGVVCANIPRRRGGPCVILEWPDGGARPPGAETLISEAPTWHKKRGRRSVPFQGSRGRGKNVCCTAASRRKFRTSAAPKIDNTAGRGAPCERAIFLRHNPLANAGEGQYTRLGFPPPVPPTPGPPANLPPAPL